jgi:hypothetical protein
MVEMVEKVLLALLVQMVLKVLLVPKVLLVLQEVVVVLLMEQTLLVLLEHSQMSELNKIQFLVLMLIFPIQQLKVLELDIV